MEKLSWSTISSNQMLWKRCGNNLSYSISPPLFLQLMAQDGIGADFRLIYREASSFKSHMIFQVGLLPCCEYVRYYVCRHLAWWSRSFHFTLRTKNGRAVLFSNHTWRQLLSFCGGAPVRFTISGCSTECPTGPQFRSLSIILSQQTEQPPRSKAFFQAVPQSSKRHLQSCPQPIASLAEEAGRALPS